VEEEVEIAAAAAVSHQREQVVMQAVPVERQIPIQVAAAAAAAVVDYISHHLRLAQPQFSTRQLSLPATVATGAMNSEIPAEVEMPATAVTAWHWQEMKFN
jgi:hypothetical protein